MILRKKSIFCTIIICFIISAGLAVYLNDDGTDYIKTKYYLDDLVGYYDCVIGDDGKTVVTTGIDPQIWFEFDEQYIKDVTIYNRKSPDEWRLQIFYAASGEKYTESNSIINTISGSEKNLGVNINKKIKHLRIDLGDLPDQTFVINRIETGSVISNPDRTDVIDYWILRPVRNAEFDTWAKALVLFAFLIVIVWIMDNGFEGTNENHSKILYYFKLTIKYLYPFLIVIGLIKSVNYIYILSILLELMFVSIFVQFLLKKSKVWGYFTNVVLMFIINAQATILYFGSTYLSLIMINNLNSIEDLGGNNGGKYIVCAIGVILCALLPMPELALFKKKWGRVQFGGILLTVDVLLCVLANGSISSPFYALVDLGIEYQQQKAIYGQLKDSLARKEDFLKSEIKDNISKPDELSDNPNIILIFTEGLSRHILYDERNIMPNVKEYENQSIHFTNYYNHTFATYNGISGQLYSGWQNVQDEENVLTSIQDILKDKGYITALINVEPYNATFSSYLGNMGFDQMITNENISTSQGGSISDRDAYDMLYDSAEILNGDGPFFLVIYTLGTHISFDSPDQMYGDGSDAALNKFYNSDYYFGEFMRKFNSSPLVNNTMLIYTTDHASYTDSDYLAAFSNANRESEYMDEIPLFIYYKGCQTMELDAAGRTSLDMAPTVLDFLDISANNYFLGNSMFADRYSNIYETYFAIRLSRIMTANNGNISYLSGSALNDMIELMSDYFAVKTSASELLPKLDVRVSDDAASATIDLFNADNYDRVRMAVWSEANGQDDLHWVEASKTEDGIWEIVINMEDYADEGLYSVHPYGYIGNESKVIMAYTFYYEK